MTHGKSAKKTAKNLSKASNKKAGGKAGTKKGKAAPAKTGKQTLAKGKGAPKSAGSGSSRTTHTHAVAKPSGPAFSNPAVAAAYNRAVKAYSGAFRKLPD
jgi:hypothetical protein